METTVIGAYPKPKDQSIKDWFQSDCNKYEVNTTQRINENEQLNGLKNIVNCQEKHNINIITDGEINRENQIYYHLRHLNGIDFNKIKIKSMRNGNTLNNAPTITNKISNNKLQSYKDFNSLKTVSNNKLKITLPGPMTIIDSINNEQYDDEQELLKDLSITINKEILKCIENGCKYVQVDEPVYVRYTDKALEYGIDYLNECFKNVPSNITKIVHICCGQMERLDQTDYGKSDNLNYIKLANKLDNSIIDQISIEDAHDYNDFEVLLPLFKNKTIILGVVKVCSSKIETVEEIEHRIEMALKYIDKERLVIAPDCGLGFLTEEMIDQKLKNMNKAREIIELNYQC